MDRRLGNTLRAYGVAICSIAVAAVLRLALSPFLGDRLIEPFFFIAVIFAHRYAGYGPSWFALWLGVLPVAYLQLTRGGTFNAFDLAAQVSIAIYILMGALILFLCKSERTARINAEINTAEARASEARLQAILDNATALIYLKDRAGGHVMVNRRFEEVFHLKPEQITGPASGGIFSADVLARLQANDEQVLSAGKALEFEETVPQDGILHTYISVKFPIKNVNGDVVAVGGISTDITDLKRATDELITERALLKKLINSQEKEKQVACYDIHDGLVQYVTGALMLAEGFSEELPKNYPSKTLDEVILSLRRAVNEGRRVIQGLRSHVLDESGLIAGIEDLIHEVAGSGLMIEFDKDGQIDRLPKAIETAVYRVVQEALTNSKKHSGSERVQIILRRGAEHIYVKVRDFGCGFDMKTVSRNAFGVMGITERVRLLGGECKIESGPEMGTQIDARLPIPGEPDSGNWLGWKSAR